MRQRQNEQKSGGHGEREEEGKRGHHLQPEEQPEEQPEKTAIKLRNRQPQIWSMMMKLLDSFSPISSCFKRPSLGPTHSSRSTLSASYNPSVTQYRRYVHVVTTLGATIWSQGCESCEFGMLLSSRMIATSALIDSTIMMTSNGGSEMRTNGI